MTVPVYTQQLPPSRDRSGLLILAGVVEAFLGLFSALAVLGTLLTLAFAGSASGAAAGGALTLGMLWPSLLMYSLATAFFVWIAVGTFQARRWARSLMVVLSSLWLLGGLFATLVMAKLMPRLLAGMASSGASAQPAGVGATILLVTGITVAIIYIALPTFFLVIYANPNVKATFEAKDPQPRWTDRCPLPVLALALVLGYSALGWLFALSHPLFPFFGMYLTGVPAIVALAVLGGICGFLAREVYFLRINGWTGALALTLFYAISAGITVLRVPLLQLYQQIGIPPEQLALMKPLFAEFDLPLMTGLWAVAALAYLVYLRRFFPGGSRYRPASELPGQVQLDPQG